MWSFLVCSSAWARGVKQFAPLPQPSNDHFCTKTDKTRKRKERQFHGRNRTPTEWYEDVSLSCQHQMGRSGSDKRLWIELGVNVDRPDQGACRDLNRSLELRFVLRLAAKWNTMARLFSIVLFSLGSSRAGAIFSEPSTKTHELKVEEGN